MVSGTLRMVCSGHSLTANVSTYWDRIDHITNSSFHYTKPDYSFNFDKSVTVGEEKSCLRTTIRCDDELAFQTTGEFGFSPDDGMYSNASILVPLREPDAKHPLVQVTFDQQFNFFKQHYHVYVSTENQLH